MNLVTASVPFIWRGTSEIWNPGQCYALRHAHRNLSCCSTDALITAAWSRLGYNQKNLPLKLRSPAFDPWLGHGRNAASRGRTPGCSTCNWGSNVKNKYTDQYSTILCGDPWRKPPKGKGVFFIPDKLESIYGFAKSKKGVGIVLGWGVKTTNNRLYDTTGLF